MIKLKRIYDRPAKSDGFRVLVERLWPRGVSKERAAIQQWLKEIAPSPELRKWYSHDVAKWDEFRRRYLKELESQDALVRELEEKGQLGTLTLVYASKEQAHNSAVVLRDYLERCEPQ